MAALTPNKKLHSTKNKTRLFDRGGDIVVHALMPVFIFRGRVVVLGEDKERQKPDRGFFIWNIPATRRSV